MSPAPLRRTTLSLCMTVKNEAAMLPRCLQSVADLVDEIVLVDTGSTDHTMAIALAYGARIFEQPWPEDFALARNAALAKASCEWILNLDGDEWLDASGREVLQAFLAAPPPPTRLRAQICNPGRDGRIEQVYFMDKLFPRSETIRFVAPIHEFLVDIAPEPTPVALMRALRIQHAGLSPERVASRDKLLRNRRILERAVADFPAESHCRYHLAVICMNMGEFARAWEHYRELLASYEHLPAANHPFFGLAVAEAMVCLEQLDEPEGALEIGLRCEAGAAAAHPAYWLQRGRLHRRLGQYPQARACFRRCLDIHPEQLETAYRPESLTVLPLLQLLALESVLSRHPDLSPAEREAAAMARRDVLQRLLSHQPDGALPGLGLNLQLLLAGAVLPEPQPIAAWDALSAPLPAITALLEAFAGQPAALYGLAAEYFSPWPEADFATQLPALAAALSRAKQALAAEGLLYLGMLSYQRPELGLKLAELVSRSGEPERARLCLLEARLCFPADPALAEAWAEPLSLGLE